MDLTMDYIWSEFWANVELDVWSEWLCTASGKVMQVYCTCSTIYSDYDSACTPNDCIVALLG